ncbi:NAD-dependent epimerase/dehydratase family protein [Vibrio parahaemolyticus]|uniref:NAD-dependent epimerase/dehydratase family protein n=1 Tax=Vibrio vulnificus TaxID=672 RepID=UPI00165E77C0|nr:NAD-dependent epimerase/dehydratase family protein [Vibrio vulnificus]EIY9800872.1 NAD-dependent epimerase/dehydratase family protein [Vibrio parahaemolyticus]EJP4175546.1 NAD-dependent epimerase/dehydratase family protein [Vibrio vulnificus]EKA6048972.1 NAD-dependent epimerase/dehydratase family protein [Vibrio vulnificus]
MKIFISGVTGYAGRNLAKHFIGGGHQVIGLLRDSTKSVFLKELGVKIFHGDLNSNNLAEGLVGCDVVIHTAADTDHKNVSVTQYDTNVLGTKQLLSAAKSSGVERFIHISTDSVLLTGKAICYANEEQPYPNKPVGLYSETKRLAEEVVLNEKSDDFNVIIVRPRFLWGRDDTTAMPQILKAISDKKFAWIDRGEYKTSMTHVGNLCVAIERAIERGTSGETYFVSDDNERSFREVITALIEAHGLTVPTNSVPRIVPQLIAKLDNVRRLFLPRSTPLPVTMQEFSTSAVEVTVDITKAKKMLDYQPVISFDEGLEEIRSGRKV